MRDSQDRNSSISGRMLAVIIVAFVLAFAILAGGPWNTAHVASNPGPSGTPGSTTLDRTRRQPTGLPGQPQAPRADRVVFLASENSPPSPRLQPRSLTSSIHNARCVSN